jgi:hypothetical protein
VSRRRSKESSQTYTLWLMVEPGAPNMTMPPSVVSVIVLYCTTELRQACEMPARRRRSGSENAPLAQNHAEERPLTISPLPRRNIASLLELRTRVRSLSRGSDFIVGDGHARAPVGVSLCRERGC